MQLSNLFQVCIYFSIGLMVFTLAINFYAGLGIFGVIAPIEGVDVSGNSSDIVESFTQNPEGITGFESAWGIVFGIGTFLGVAGAIAIAIATKNATFVGVYVFSIYFWASYINALGVLNFGGFFPATLLIMFTVPIGFIFVGALIGMLSGV